MTVLRVLQVYPFVKEKLKRPFKPWPHACCQRWFLPFSVHDSYASSCKRLLNTLADLCRTISKAMISYIMP